MSDTGSVRRAQSRVGNVARARWNKTVFDAEYSAPRGVPGIGIVSLWVCWWSNWSVDRRTWPGVPTDDEFAENMWDLLPLGTVAFLLWLVAVETRSARWGAILSSWSGGMAKLAVALAVIFTSSATAAWYQQAIAKPGLDPYSGNELVSLEYSAAGQYFWVALSVGILALGISMHGHRLDKITLRAAPKARWRNRVVLAGVGLCAYVSFASLGRADALGVQVPFQGYATAVTVSGLLLMMSPGAALRRVGAGAVGFALAILSTTWGFLYDLGYQTRHLVTDAGKTVQPGRLDLTPKQAAVLEDLSVFYVTSALFLLLAVALTILHNHQSRVD